MLDREIAERSHMITRLIFLLLISVMALGCGATPAEKPDITQAESQPVAESPKTAVAAPPTAVPPTAVPPTAVPTPDPVTLTGEGEKATEFFELEKGLWIVNLEHAGSSNFIVALLDGNGDTIEYLSNEIGTFEGSLAIKIDDSAAYLLDVQADGSWSVGFSLPD